LTIDSPGPEEGAPIVPFEPVPSPCLFTASAEGHDDHMVLPPPPAASGTCSRSPRASCRAPLFPRPRRWWRRGAAVSAPLDGPGTHRKAAG